MESMKRTLTTLALETLQNLPCIIGGVTGLYWWHNQQPWVGMGSLVFGSLGCAWLISATEGFKISLTKMAIVDRPTLPGQRVVQISGMTALFSAAFFLVWIYLEQDWSDWKTDMLVAIVLASAVSLLEVVIISASVLKHRFGNMFWLRVLTHTLSFIVTGMVILPGLRFVMQHSSTLWLAIFWAIPVTLVMSLLITAIDYLPFFKNDTRGEYQNR